MPMSLMYWVKTQYNST